jgi:hypothetical protein
MLLILKFVFHLVVQHQYQTRAHRAVDVAQVALEEALHTFFSQGFLVTVHGTCIFDFDVGSFSTRLHHQFTTHRIERKRYSLTGGHHKLGKEELFEEVRFLQRLIVTKHQSFASVVTSEVEGSVNKNTDH